MARVIIEMGGGSKGEEPGRYMEVGAAPDWVKLALMEGTGGQSTVRKIYSDGSFSEWRLKVVK